MIDNRSIVLLGLAVSALGSLGACGKANPVDGAGHGPDASGIVLPTGDGGIWVDGSFGFNADGGFCSGSGPIVVVGDTEGGALISACTGQLAEATFKNALCSCQDVNLQGYLRTRGFNSGVTPSDGGASEYGAPVGINHDYVIPQAIVNAGFTDIGGSFSVAGPDSIKFIGDLTVKGDFHVASDLDVIGYTPISRDAWLGGNVQNAGYATVGGDLHITGNDVLPLTVKGSRTKQTVTVPPPCDCGSILDIAALVDGAKTHNDNASIGLATNALHNILGVAAVTLPCGKYYLDDISGIGEITLHVSGRVALFIEGSITAAAYLQVDLAPTAEIDVFVKGTLILAGEGSFGSKSRPAATRIYVNSSEQVVLVGASGFVGNLYAPRATVTSVGYAKVYGSIFANNFIVPGYADISYDRSITDAGGGCGLPPPATCTQCGICTGGTACVGGQCGACTTNTDCCGQDVCVNGKCEPLVVPQ